MQDRTGSRSFSLPEFTVNMQWRFDLSTSTSDPTFQPFSMNIQAVVNDSYLGVVLAIPTAIRIAFADVAIRDC